MRQNISILALAGALMLGAAFAPQGAWAGTAFTYQGELSQLGAAVNGPADFQCSLWNSLNLGTQIGSTFEAANVTVQNGVFTLSLDFGITPFSSEGRWLEIAVRAPAGAGNFTTLSPRQELTPAPYALKTRGIYVDDLDNITMSLSQAQGTATVQSLGGIEFVIDADTNNGGGEDQNARMVLKQDGGLVVGRVGFRNNENTLEIMQEFDDNLVLGTNNTSVMTMTNVGFTGLGTGVPQAKLHILTGGTDQPLNVTTVGTGAGARIALVNGTNTNPALNVVNTGDGPGLNVDNSGDGSAVNVSNSGEGAALAVASSAVDVPALKIISGAIQVQGAGVNTQTAAFLHETTAGNITDHFSTINHPLLNNNPNALVFVTLNTIGLQNTSTPNPYGAWYDSDLDRWRIYNTNLNALSVNIRFAVLVILP